MATITCQELKSCLESQVVESPRSLRLQLCPPKPFEHHSSFKSSFPDSATLKSPQKFHNDQKTSNPDSGSWSFLQAITNSNSSSQEKPNPGLYIHPLTINPTTTTLSQKSLELCTENLGSETGTDILDNDIFSSSFDKSFDNPLGSNKDQDVQTRRSSQQITGTTKKGGHYKDRVVTFPPPLTTIRGLDRLQVSPYREDGRLVIRANMASPPSTCFRVDRSNGRLVLTALVEQDFEDLNHEGEEDFNDEIENEDIAGHSSSSFEEEMGDIEKLQWPGRSAEGHEHELEIQNLLNRETHFCVAAS